MTKMNKCCKLMLVYAVTINYEWDSIEVLLFHYMMSCKYCNTVAKTIGKGNDYTSKS